MIYRLVDDRGVICAVGSKSQMEWAKGHYLGGSKILHIEPFTPDVRTKAF